MANINDHPTVVKIRSQNSFARTTLSGQQLEALAIRCGADDCGVISISRNEIADQREDILRHAPWTKSLVAFVCKMNREPIRSTARSVANLEFHHTGERVNDVARQIVSELESLGIRAVNPSMGFPMEMDEFPGKIWVVSHKPVAVAAGLGKMGIHRNVIHPKYGNFILLGTVLVDSEIDGEIEPQPVEFNPCLECKLCVAACPVGAIGPEGSFNFSACYSHNYREFMGGFTDWVEDVAASKSKKDYRNRMSDSESSSMWQSLSFGASYKAAYCLAVCPAGEDVISPFLADRGQFVKDTLKPVQQKVENIYVQRGTDAEAHVKKRFPHKPVRYIGNSLRPTTIPNFIHSMHLVFQPGKSKGLDAIYHFRFTGADAAECTVAIRDQKIEVLDGHRGECDLFVTASASGWLAFVRKEMSIVWLLLTLRVRPWGDPRLLVAFGKCFP